MKKTIKVVVVNLKGGPGKTTVSQLIAQHPAFDANVITNDSYQSLYKLYPQDCKLLDLNHVLNNWEKLGDTVFDLGGFLDSNILEIIKKSDFVIVPCKSDIDTFQTTLENLEELNLSPKKLIVIDNMKKKGDKDIVKKGIHMAVNKNILVLPLRETKLPNNCKTSIPALTLMEYLKKDNKIKLNWFGEVVKEIDEIVVEILTRNGNKNILKISEIEWQK